MKGRWTRRSSHNIEWHASVCSALATSVLLSVLAAVALTSFVIPSNLDASVQKSDIHSLNVCV